MPLNEFWHEEESLIYAYKKAYDRNMYHQAQVYGQYTYIALETALGNMFMKKGQEPLKYPNEIYDPYQNKNKKLTKKDVESKHRESNAFWSNLGKTN